MENNQKLSLEITYLGDGNDGKKFGCFFQSTDDVETLAYFQNLKNISMDTKTAPFFVDLKEDGDIEDTIGISNEVFTRITGEDVREPEYYEQCDREFWQGIQEIRELENLKTKGFRLHLSVEEEK